MLVDLVVVALAFISTARGKDSGSGCSTVKQTSFAMSAPPDRWVCQPRIDFWKTYCLSYQAPKSFAMPADCSYEYEWHGNSESTNVALEKCQNASGKQCYTYDNNGRNCFSGCTADWPHFYAQAEWKDYCNANKRAGQAWFMPDDCSSYGYAFNFERTEEAWNTAKSNCENRTNKTCQLFDDGGKHIGPRCLPACWQVEPEWCWATATAEIASFWNPIQFPVNGDNCMSLECQIASYATGKDCCADKDACDHAGHVNTTFLHEQAGSPPYIYIAGQLSETDLRAALDAGPIVVRIAWPNNTGAHFLTVGGMIADPTTYFVHDPLVKNQQGKYQDISYDGLRTYQEPDGRYDGTWDGTVHIEATLVGAERPLKKSSDRRESILV